jgi:gliding motility-associated lipoprotein GldH
MMKHLFLLLAGATMYMLVSCNQTYVFNNNVEFPKAQWAIKDSLVFKVDIKDPKIPYRLFYNVRNTKDYPYYNLFVKRYMYNAKGQQLTSNISELILHDETTGKPKGSGLGDIYDQRINLKGAFQFPEAGQYTIVIKQYMRQNPLPEVVSFGFGVEPYYTK